MDRTSKSDRSERLEAAYDAMLDDDFDDEMMISDMPTMNNKTNSKNKHDATTVTSNSGDTRFQNISNMTEKTCAPNNGDHAIEREETDKRKRTLFNVNRDVDDFGRRSPQPSTSRVTGWLNKSTHMVVPDKDSQESQSPVVPNQSKPLNTSAIDTTLHEEDDEEDIVPGTPPSKKFRSLFFGMSQASTNSQVSQPKKSKPVVLVEDSDED